MAEEGRPETPAPRRYREEEVSEILDRASSQEVRPDLPAPFDPTLPDLLAAATEAGLDPGEVRRAAALEARPHSAVVAAVLGGADRRELRAHLPGGRLPRDTWGMVRAAERASGSKGDVVESVPHRFTWRAQGLARRHEVTLAAQGDGVELTLRADAAGSYFGLWLAGVVAWAALSALTPLGALPALGKLATFLVVPFLVARPFWAAQDRALRRRMEGLALELLRRAEEEGPGARPLGEDAGA